MSKIDKDILKFSTAGSVDDGKSTLIGRLLYETNSITENLKRELEENTKRKRLPHLDFSLVTDGLKDERSQGITIDVAYRYFETEKRKFIIADTPGHIQYTRNMITGASRVNLALILIDARKGIVEQTKRHAFIASLLHISHIIICVNKMDLVDYEEAVFNDIVNEFTEFSKKLSTQDVRYIPISALYGENVVTKSEQMKWYDGRPLLSSLESLHISADQNLIDFRFPIQMIIRPHTEEYHDFRGYAGKVVSGSVKKGDEIVVLPSGFTSKIKSILCGEEKVVETLPNSSVVLTLEDDIDISRGNLIARVNNRPQVVQEFNAMLCWLSDSPANLKAKYTLQHTTNKTKAIIKNVMYKIDINTLHRMESTEQIGMNDILKVEIKVANPIFADSYSANKNTGAFILVDEFTKETVASGMII